MRKIEVILSALLVLSMVSIISSCKKKGCTDSDAYNFNSSAKKSDGTCRFEGSFIFWMADSTAQKMQNDGIQTLTVYLDGDVIGQLNTSQSFVVAPDCGTTGAVSITKDLFSVKNRAFSFRIIDDQSVLRRAGTVEFVGNQCEQFELLYYP